MCAVVGELRQLGAEFDTAAQGLEPGMQCAVGAVLGDQPGVRVRDVGAALAFGHRAVRDGEGAEMDAHRRVQGALIDDVGQGAQVLENLESARLDAFGARAVEGVRRLVDEAYRHAAAG
ncbi:Uncharacterised protein [Mycobacteroides abscessus subsp. abscessus]|nr:Uncharacterised protein [Mycobacteroides abscessus subsp. abscessus]